MAVYVLDASRVSTIEPVSGLIADPIAATHWQRSAGHPSLVADDFIFLHADNIREFKKSLANTNKKRVVVYSGSESPPIIDDENEFFATISVRDLVSWVLLFQKQVKNNSSEDIAKSLSDFITNQLKSSDAKGLVAQFITLTYLNLLMGIPICFDRQTKAVAFKLIELKLVPSFDELKDKNNIVELARRYL